MPQKKKRDQKRDFTLKTEKDKIFAMENHHQAVMGFTFDAMKMQLSIKQKRVSNEFIAKPIARSISFERKIYVESYYIIRSRKQMFFFPGYPKAIFIQKNKKPKC